MEVKHNIYINIDGFAKYYFDELTKRFPGDVFLEKIINEGVFLNNLKNVLPSITNPCQNMILSGSTSKITKNVYRYYDRNQKVVIQQKRENKTKLLSEVAVENNKSVVSVAHFLTEKDLTSYDKKRLYVKQDLTDNNLEYYNYEERFNQLINLIDKKPIKVDGKEIILDELPDLLILYCDDIDGLGHNFASTYGSKVATNEEERINNVIYTLRGIDNKVKEMVDALKKNGLYSKTRIFLTTDHGMTPYGNINNINSEYGYSKIPDLINKLKDFNNDLKIEFLSPGESPESDTNLVIVGANLNVQLTFLDDISQENLDRIKSFIENEKYIYKIKTRKELDEEGYWTFAADMIISPSERYYFGKKHEESVNVRAQHDSMQKSSNEVVGWIFGGDVKKTGKINDDFYNYDFGTTIAKSLNVKLPNSNGKIIDVFEKL